MHFYQASQVILMCIKFENHWHRWERTVFNVLQRQNITNTKTWQIYYFLKANRSVLLVNIDSNTLNKILANRIKQHKWSSFPESNDGSMLRNLLIWFITLAEWSPNSSILLTRLSRRCFRTHHFYCSVCYTWNSNNNEWNITPYETHHMVSHCNVFSHAVSPSHDQQTKLSFFFFSFFIL